MSIMAMSVKDGRGDLWFFHSFGECDQCHLEELIYNLPEDPAGHLYCARCVWQEGAKLKREGSECTSS